MKNFGSHMCVCFSILDLDTKKETAMENAIDTEGQTRFFDELGRKFYASFAP